MKVLLDKTKLETPEFIRSVNISVNRMQQFIMNQFETILLCICKPPVKKIPLKMNVSLQNKLCLLK